MITKDKDIYLLDKLLQAGYIMKDIKILLGLGRTQGNKDIREILSQPMYRLNIEQVLAIANALNKSPMYIIDAAQFGGKDILRMNGNDYAMWMKRLASEPLESDVRRNLTWAIGKGFKVVDMVKEYLDNHPEIRVRKVKVNPYQYKILKESGELDRDYIHKSSSTKAE